MIKYTLTLALCLYGCIANIQAQSSFASKLKNTIPAAQQQRNEPAALLPHTQLSAYLAQRTTPATATPAATLASGITLTAPSVDAPALLLQSGIADPSTQRPILLEGKSALAKSNSLNKSTAETAARQFLQKTATVLQINDADQEWQLRGNDAADELGMFHFKAQQQFAGLEIFGAEVAVHVSPDGEVVLNGRSLPTPATVAGTIPSLTQESALAFALSELEKKTTVADYNKENTDFPPYLQEVHQAQLLIYPLDEQGNDMRLAWHLTVFPNFIERWEYFIDAHTGEVLNTYNHTCALGPDTGTAPDLNGVSRSIKIFKSGSTYYLYDTSKSMYTGGTTSLPQEGQGSIVTLDFNNSTTNNPNYGDCTSTTANGWTPTEVSAHYNASVAYDYYLSKHTWKSVDGNGGDLVSFINVADDNGGGLDNAFWNGSYMFYGNGATAFKPLAKGLDVAGHEMTHGVIQSTANLIYQNQPGAINEHLADVFGAMIDSDDWKMGEDVVKTSVFPSGCLRDLQNPHNGGTGLGSNGWQPDKMSEIYSGSQDNGGVHINSGIPNKAFYNFASVVSKPTAEKVYFRAMKQYLTKSSKFVDLRIAIIKAATDLYGATSNEVQKAKQAFDAVGISDGTPTNTDPILEENPGDEFILLINTTPTDNNTLYLSSTVGNNFVPLTTIVPNRKPSITDDGAYIVFVGSNNNIYTTDLTENPAQTFALTSDAYWDNVAISKDGSKLACIPKQAVPEIWVYDFGQESWKKYDLYNPTTGSGVNLNSVQYADALEWDYSGEYVYFDSYNEIGGTNSKNYWDLGVLRVWNKSTNSFGDGNILPIFSNLPEGVSIGNPALAKTSPNVLGFDYFSESSTAVMAVNTETGDVGTIFQNQVLGYPSYSIDDQKMVFTSLDNNGKEVVAQIAIQSNKINSTGDASVLVGEAKWPTWFATGDRDYNTGIADKDFANLAAMLYPNPSRDELRFVSTPATAAALVGASIIDLKGVEIARYAPQNLNNLHIGIAHLASGTYFVRLEPQQQSNEKNVVQYFKFVKN